MKRFVLIIAALVVVCMSSLCVCAESSPNVCLGARACEKDRLFDVYLTLNNFDSVSGSQVIIDYDETHVQYRGIMCDEFDIQVSDDGSKLCLVVLCEDSNCVEDVAAIRFKGIAQGSANIKVESVDCYDNSLIPVQAECNSVDVLVSENSVSVNKSSLADVKTEKSSISETDKDIHSSKYAPKTSTADVGGMSVNNGGSSSKYLVYIIGAVVVLGLSGVLISEVVKRKS